MTAEKYYGQFTTFGKDGCPFYRTAICSPEPPISPEQLEGDLEAVRAKGEAMADSSWEAAEADAKHTNSAAEAVDVLILAINSVADMNSRLDAVTKPYRSALKLALAMRGQHTAAEALKKGCVDCQGPDIIQNDQDMQFACSRVNLGLPGFLAAFELAAMVRAEDAFYREGPGRTLTIIDVTVPRIIREGIVPLALDKSTE
jgi:hypothetical protein